MDIKNIKIGAVSWGLPGAGYYAPKVANSLGLDGIQLELGSYEMGYPLANNIVLNSYIEDGEKYNIIYPAIVLNDLMEHEFINGRETENSKIAYEQIEIAVDVADKMNIRKIMIPNFMNNLITEEKHIENTIETLQFACDLAQERNITILTENALNWKGQRELIKNINRPNIKIHFDTQNFKYNFDMDQLEQLENLFDLMDNQLHVKDGINNPGEKLLGQGNTDFYKQMKFLKEHDFEGWIITENYYNMYPLRDDIHDQNKYIKADIQTIKNCFK